MACLCMGPPGNCPCLRRARGEYESGPWTTTDLALGREGEGVLMTPPGEPISRPKPKFIDDSVDEIYARIQELKREKQQRPEPEYIPQNDYGDCG